MWESALWQEIIKAVQCLTSSVRKRYEWSQGQVLLAPSLLSRDNRVANRSHVSVPPHWLFLWDLENFRLNLFCASGPFYLAAYFFVPLFHFCLFARKIRKQALWFICYLKVHVVIFFSGKTFIQSLLFSIMSLFLQKLKRRRQLVKELFCKRITELSPCVSNILLFYVF